MTRALLIPWAQSETLKPAGTLSLSTGGGVCSMLALTRRLVTIILMLPFLLLGLAAVAHGAQPGDVIQLSPIEIKAPASPTSQPFVPAAYRETPLPSYPTAAR